MAHDDIKTDSVFAGLWRAASQYRWRTLLAVGLLVLAKIAGVIVPLGLKAIVDRFSRPEGLRNPAGDSGPTAMLVLPVFLLLRHALLRISVTLFSELLDAV